jgi:hypothetical protein
MAASWHGFLANAIIPQHERQQGINRYNKGAARDTQVQQGGNKGATGASSHAVVPRASQQHMARYANLCLQVLLAPKQHHCTHTLQCPDAFISSFSHHELQYVVLVAEEEINVSRVLTRLIR